MVVERVDGAREMGCGCVVRIMALRARVKRDGVLGAGLSIKAEEMEREIWRTWAPETARESATGAMEDV